MFSDATFTALCWQVFLQARFVQIDTLAPKNLGKFWQGDIQKYRDCQAPKILAELSWRKLLLNHNLCTARLFIAYIMLWLTSSRPVCTMTQTPPNTTNLVLTGKAHDICLYISWSHHLFSMENLHWFDPVCALDTG